MKIVKGERKRGREDILSNNKLTNEAANRGDHGAVDSFALAGCVCVCGAEDTTFYNLFTDDF